MVTVNTVTRTKDAVQIAFKENVNWQGIWLHLRYAFSRNDNIFHLDYSDFTHLEIEMRGANGGEKILLNIEDYDDPKDGSSTRLPLTLSDEWQTYNVPLSEFKTANFKKISVPFGIVYLEQDAATFFIRNVRYITQTE